MTATEANLTPQARFGRAYQDQVDHWPVPVTSWHVPNFAFTLPSTMSRLQAVISPENEVPDPTIIVRTSICLLDGSDCGSAFWGGGGEGSAEPRRLPGRPSGPSKGRPGAPSMGRRGGVGRR